MTKQELELAQYLYGVYERAGWQLPKLPAMVDCHGDYGTIESVADRVHTIRDMANRAFAELTGKFPGEVSEVELSTVHPAPWTKTARNTRGRR